MNKNTNLVGFLPNMKKIGRTRESILEVARSLFARFGLKKSTVDEIAECAGVGKGTIYYHFPSKESIFLAVIKKEAGQLSRRQREAVSEVKTPQEKLRALFECRLRSLTDLPNLKEAILNLNQIQWPRLSRLMQQVEKEKNRLVENILSEGKESGVFAVDDVKQMTASLITAFRGFELSHLQGEQLEQALDTLDQLFQMLFKGLELRTEA